MMTLRRLNGRAGTGGWRAGLLALGLPLALALGACSGDSPQPSTVTTQDTSSQPYPNLASVPDKPPPVSPEEIRASTAEGLAADRANAQYTGSLTADGTAQPAAQPPGPPPPEPVVKVSEVETTQTRITESGTIQSTDEVRTTVTETQGGVTTSETTVEDTEVDQTETQGGAIATAEVQEADADEILSNPQRNEDVQDADTVIDETDDDVAEQIAPSVGGAPAPSPSGTTTTPGGVTEVTSIVEVCKVAEPWERQAYGCDNLPAQPTAPAPQTAAQPTPTPAPAPAPAPAPSQVTSQSPSYTPAPAPAPAPTPAPAPATTAQPAPPPPPAYSPTPPAPAPGTPQVANTPPGQQAPLSINPPVGGGQVPQPTTQAAPTPAVPAQPQAPLAVTPTPAPAPAPASGGATTVTATADVCKVAEPWERQVYGCDNPAGQPVPQQATAPSVTPSTAGAAQPPLVPAPGTVGAGRVELVGVIFFAHGSSALDGRDAQVLQQIAQLHKQYGGIVRVVGNASARTGNMSPVDHELANFEVSMERAGAVAGMLQRYGVAATAIVTEARSDTAPVYHEFMPSGEAGNRRAEIYLEY